MQVNKSKSSLIGWMANNHIAVNLLMVVMLVAGVYYFKNIRQEIQPNYTFSTVLIEMSYPGASPEEIEQNIVLAIEAKLETIEGLNQVTSTASEGYALVRAEIANGENLDRILQSVKNAVDSISSFPADAERPIIRLDDDAPWLTTLAITGEIDTKSRYELVKRIKADLMAIDGIALVLSRVKKEPEINIEIAQQSLELLNLSIPDVAEKIKLAVKDVPSGYINTPIGDYVLRTEGRRETAIDFLNIPIKNTDSGDVVNLGDVATVSEGFNNDNHYFSYNGQPGDMIYVYQTKASRTLTLVKDVEAYVDDLRNQLPDNIKIEFPYKRAEKFEERITSLINNGVIGLLLVMLVLGIFLNPRLAFWVGISIPVVFISSFTFLSYLDVSINMISTFAFIMTLGVVVDDAIIVGENIQARILNGAPIKVAVAEGTTEMFLPVTIAVLTNIIAFIPLLTMPGNMGKYMLSLPLVAIVVFCVSLVEALFILPAHLNAKPVQKKVLYFRRVELFRIQVAKSLDIFRDGTYAKCLNNLLRHRYSVFVVFMGLLSISFVWFESNRIDFRWFPQVPSDNVSARLELPIDSSPAELTRIAKHIEQAGLLTINEMGSKRDIVSWDVSSGISTPNYAKVTFNLSNEKLRGFDQKDFVRQWRENVGRIPQAKSLQYDYLAGFGGNDRLSIDVRHPSVKTSEAVAQELASILTTFDGVYDVADGLTQGKKQLKFELTSEAKALGITEYSLGQQIKSSFWGFEAVRFLKDSDLVKVWVRLPENERESLSSLQTLQIVAPSGVTLPLAQAASIEESRAFSSIIRNGGKRNISVSGFVDPEEGNFGLVKRSLSEEILPRLRAKYPGLEIGMRGTLDKFSGRSSIEQLLLGLVIVCVVVFVLFASLFKSYVQGAIVVLTIPFSIAAAVFGHVVMGYTLTSNSLFGMVALSGLVVNGAFVLTTKLNQMIDEGKSLANALLIASRSRFKAVVLTSVTTTAGLLPMLFETSEQALFLVPFAIALSFGTVASMFIILFLIPCLHAISFDLMRYFQSRAMISRGDSSEVI